MAKGSNDRFLFPPEALKQSDFGKGHPSLLAQLTSVGEITQSMYESRFDEIQKFSGTYYVIVIEDVPKSKVVTSGTLILEKKFTHRCGCVGHIEDIVVDSDYRGQQLGKLIIDQLKSMGEALGVYKIILDCNDNNVDFYERCGFQKKENCMAWYIPGR